MPITGRRSVKAMASALFALTKPRIIELLLVTTIPTMLLADRGLPSVRVLLVTLAGGALAAGSANTINCYIDRDIDAMMRRTSRRPLARPAPMAVVKPFEALIFGIVLVAARQVPVLLLRDGLLDPGPRALRRLDLHGLRGRPGRLVPRRGAPAAHKGHPRRRTGPSPRGCRNRSGPRNRGRRSGSGHR